MKTVVMRKKAVLAVIGLVLGGGLGAQPAQQIKQAANQGVLASGHASASAGHGLMASGQLTSAVVALPLAATGVVLGTVAGASNQLAESAAAMASQPIGTPLPVANEHISIMAPSEALKTNKATP